MKTIVLCKIKKIFAIILFFLPISCVMMQNNGINHENTSVVNDYKNIEIKPKINTVPIVSENEPLKISIQDAILLSINNNPSIMMEKINPIIRQTFEDQEQSAFDPSINANVSLTHKDTQSLSQFQNNSGNSKTDLYAGAISLKKFFPTGTYIEAELSTDITDSSMNDQVFSTGGQISITQHLKRGYGKDVNIARLRQAKIDTEITRYEFRGFCEFFVAQVETAYWDYALAQRQIEIVEESLKVSKQQLSETESMIQVGSMAESEITAVQAEVATQEQEFINAKSSANSVRLQLLRLVNPPTPNFWNKNVVLMHTPTIPKDELKDIESHIAKTLEMRSEINQAKLDIDRQKLEIVRTKNGMLPLMDIFISLGNTGYANSFFKSAGNIGDGYEATAGISFEYPFFNRDAKAQHRRAILNQEQTEIAFKNLKQLVELDVHLAFVEVFRTKEQISASSATMKLQEEKLRIETEKFRVGRSTSFFVAQAQRDLLASRINEIKALVNYLKALTNFFKLEGTLLERRGIIIE
ncbi:MAG: TolC family protein [Desulfobacterales bacterium]|nr:TolC family protein [Desulfobacterales bacterium]